jgi:hypothetical protein
VCCPSQVAPRLIAVRGYINLILHEDTTQSDTDTLRSEACGSQHESSFAAFGVCPAPGFGVRCQLHIGV